ARLDEGVALKIWRGAKAPSPRKAGRGTVRGLGSGTLGLRLSDRSLSVPFRAKAGRGALGAALSIAVALFIASSSVLADELVKFDVAGQRAPILGYLAKPN